MSERGAGKFGLFGTPRGRIRVALLSLVVLALCAVFFLFFDKDIALYLRETLSKETRDAFLPVTELGKADWYLVAAVMAWIIGRIMFVRAAPMAVARAWHALARSASFVLATLALSAVVVHAIKLTVGRARPKALFQDAYYGAAPMSFDTSLSSFPSGHSQTVWAIMSACMFLYPRAWPLFAAWASVIAASRVIVGAHFPSDIVMGGFIAALTAIYVRRKWFADLEAPDFRKHISNRDKTGDSVS